MQGVFISYRRDDASGHAGRLFDRLAARFGEDHVFMDVTDLKPGEDFADAIGRALDQCQVLLAIIGPQWLSAQDASGRRRLEQGDDFVHREIAAALERHALVIPVLVRGASMPPEESLPVALRDLARRQAVPMLDERWNQGMEELLHILDSRIGPAREARVEPGAAAPDRPGAARKSMAPRFLVGAAAVTLLAGVAWWLLAPERPGEPKAGKAGDPVGNAPRPKQPGSQTAGEAQTQPASGPPRYAIPLPAPSEVTLRAVGNAESLYRILAIRQEPWGSDQQLLTFLIRLTNRKPSPDSFSDSSFRLRAGGAALAPVSSLNKVVAASAADEGELRFRAPAGAVDVELEITNGGKALRMPVSLVRRDPIRPGTGRDEFGRPARPRVVDVLKPLPLALPAGMQASVEWVAFQVLGVEVERDSIDRAAVVVTVRCTVDAGRPGTNFWSDSLRLVADGIPLAPENSVNEVVAGGASKDARFIFSLRDMPQSLELQFRDHGSSARVPLPLTAVAQR